MVRIWAGAPPSTSTSCSQRYDVLSLLDAPRVEEAQRDSTRTTRRGRSNLGINSEGVMRQLKFVRSAAATVIAASIMTSAADVWAQDKKCKDHFHIGVATARTLSGAQQAAIRRWKFQVTRH